jgi:hypothetical protein
MEVDYDFPGSVSITLNSRDLERLHEPGVTVERDGFSGIESKTWVHLGRISTEPSFPNKNHAVIEPGGDLHVHLSRGFGLPLTIDRLRIEADEVLIDHFLGEDGVIIIKL